MFYVWKRTYLMYCTFKVQYIGPNCFSIFIFEALLLRLEVGMTFKDFQNGSNNKYCVVEMHKWPKLWLLHVVIEWKSIHYFAYGLQIPPNREKFSLYENHSDEKTRTQCLRFHKNHTRLVKAVRFPCRDQRFLSSSLTITINCWDFHKLFKKKQVIL